MFDSAMADGRSAAPSAASRGLESNGLRKAALRAWVAALATPDPELSDTERIELLRSLEELKAAAAGAQARLTVDFVASQRAAQQTAGMPARRIGQGIPAQVALARRESPARGSRLVGLAQALLTELPQTYAALQSGQVSEWRATLIARETACLDPDLRRTADGELAPRLPALGDRQTETEAARIAYRLDPHAFLARTRKAEQDRRVTLRPAPDTMTRLTALLPVTQGVAAYAALLRDAGTLRASGDPRSRGQVMADRLVELVTGQTTATDTPVEICLVMTDHTLFGHRHVPSTDPDAHVDTEDAEVATDIPGGDPSDEPAHVVGAGPIPASLARQLLRDRAGTVWVRRLYTSPDTGQLAAMDSRRRLFPQPLRQLIVLRDQYCRTSWCGAPIRHTDHVTPAAAGGVTSEANGQGLCESCNYAKQAAGWQATPSLDGGAGRTVTTITPTGHTYSSHPPPTPRSRPPATAVSADRRLPQHDERHGAPDSGKAAARPGWRPPDVSHAERLLAEYLHAA